MSCITTVGFDLAKNVFQVHGVDACGKIRAGVDKLLVILKESKDRLAADALEARAGLTVQLSSAEGDIEKLEARLARAYASGQQQRGQRQAHGDQQAGRRLSETPSGRRSDCGLAPRQEGQSGKAVGDAPSGAQTPEGRRRSNASRTRDRSAGSSA
jgi:hypothetical protein